MEKPVKLVKSISFASHSSLLRCQKGGSREGAEKKNLGSLLGAFLTFACAAAGPGFLGLSLSGNEK
jgi:hypothetical protein